MGRPSACKDLSPRPGAAPQSFEFLWSKDVALLVVAWLILWSVAMHATADSGPADFVTRSWLTEQGLPQNSVNALAQTRDGFLWIGTNGGIARFDGSRFRQFGLLDGLGSVRVSALAEDSNGSLWVGTTGGGVSRWDNGRFTTFRGGEGFPTVGDILAIASDGNGGVWFGTSDSLILWREGVFRAIGEMENMPRRQILALAVDTAGAVWASVLGDGVMKWDGARFETPGHGERPKDAYSFAADPDGSIWAGCGNGEVWQWKGGGWNKFDAAHGLPKGSIIGALSVDQSGNLWVGTRGHGFYRKEGDRFIAVAAEREGGALSVRSLLVDRHGSIWGGLALNGLIRFSTRFVHFIEIKMSSGTISGTTLTADANGKVWLVGDTDGVSGLERSNVVKVESPEIPRGFFAYCGIAGNDGTVWIGGEQRLVEFRDGGPPKAHTEPPIRGEALRALCVDGDSLWIGTYHSALLKKDANGVHAIAERNSFGGSITSMVLEAPGVLWIGSFGGLYRWERGVAQSWGERDGLVTRSILAMHRESDGTLYLGTQGGGLARMKDGKFAHITTRHGLIDDVVSQIVADDLGSLWLGTNRGIMAIERSELEAVADGAAAEVHPIIIDRNDGLLSEQCLSGRAPLAFKSKEGHLYFPTARGVAIIDPHDFHGKNSTVPLRVLIDEFRVDGRLVGDSKPELGPGPHRIEVSYTAPFLHGGEWVRYRHRLDGIDRDWVVASGQRRASYEALPPGRYVFSVNAADGRGDREASTASMAFTVRPHFWQTLWFRGGGVILLAGSAVAVAWSYLRGKHRRHIEMIERERAQHAEIAHAGRVALLGELSASLAHELKQPLAAILSNAQAGLRFLESDGVGEIHDILHDIAEADRRASEIIGRMRDMVKKGDAQLEARDLNADLHQALMLIRSDLVGRNVSVSTELAPGLPLICGDHIQLQQVLLNLIMNGCDAMHSVPVEERRLTIETARDGASFARVSIIDQGSGISPGMIDRIFDPFFSTKSHGLGMGLAICRAIVNAHGGKLWAENNPERGATFHFTVRVGEQGG